MAKISEVVNSKSVKVNLGDYQSADFFVSMKSLEVADAKRTTAELEVLCTAAMLANLRGHFAARGKKLSDADICKRYGLKMPATKKDDFG